MTNDSRITQVTQGEKFWGKVEVRDKDQCWIWRGPTNTSGYGMFGARRATHFALEISGKRNPGGVHVLHSCDNRICVNPLHLRWGTNEENVKDMIDRKRHHNNRKKECVKGHALAGDNLINRKNGQRGCRICQREHDAAYKLRKAIRNLAKVGV